MDHRLQCQCGTIRGHLALPATAIRAICYCKDCQAFARYLGRASDVLDEDGGTDILATLPSHVRFEQGLDALACMSLSDTGILRWYASCCRTPLGNTPRDRKTHYVGLVHSCLASESLDASFGPARLHFHAKSARGQVRDTPLSTVFAIFKLMSWIIPARLTSRYRENPFFDAVSGDPIRPSRVLSKAEVSALKTAA
jgi:hypothetical protein